MSLLANSNAIESGGYNIDRSLRFRSSASAYLNRTFGAGGNVYTYSFSGWIKRGALGSQQGIFGVGTAAAGDTTWFGFTSTDNFILAFNDGTYFLQTTQVFRDPSAYYHVMFVVDTTQATASNRVKLFINGSQVTAFSTATYPLQNSGYQINGQFSHRIAARLRASSTDSYFDGYLAEVNFIDGQALTPSSFGQTDVVTGVWQPKKYTGTYGTNGFYLPFSDNTSATTLAYDKSGNGNNWTANNISTTAGSTYDSMTDVPTLTSATAANYCVWNPLSTGSGTTVVDGNLKSTINTAGGTDSNTYSTIEISSSVKTYAEFLAGNVDIGGAGVLPAGLQTSSPNVTGVAYFYFGAASIGGGSAKIYVNGSLSYDTSANWSATDVLGIAVDRANSKVWFSKNGTWLGSGTQDPSTNSGGYAIGSTASFYANIKQNSSYNNILIANFGQRPFSYTPPTGFNALNTFNLPDPTIKKPNQYMDATLYTGNGTSQSVVNAAGFQPDFVWIKLRNQSGDYHNLFDSVRGVYKRIFSNDTNAEDTNTQTLTAFNSNGFSVGNNGNVNTNGINIVGWQWKAGGTSSSNTSGSITSTVSVNTTAGFSVVTYTGNGVAGATIGHGLGVAPKMIVVKQRASGGTNWLVYHAGVNGGTIPQYYNMKLNLANAQEGLTAGWNDTSPTSSVFSVGTSTAVNSNGGTYVAYCWTNIAGYSNFGYYTGNGDANGVFVYLGFRPKYIMFKRTDTGGFGWEILDTSRDPYNVSSNALYANLSDAEGSTSPYSLVDILSNGFKHRSDGYLNQGTGTYIYAAFAENPFKYSLAR